MKSPIVWICLVVIAASLLFGPPCSEVQGTEPEPCTEGFVPWGCTWEHMSLTHNGDPVLAAAISYWAAYTNLENGGYSEDPDIVVEYHPLAEYAGLTQPQINNQMTYIVGAYIIIDPNYAGDFLLMVHEVGHALGFDHEYVEAVSIMHMPYYGSITAIDVEKAQAAYGVRRGLYVEARKD